MGQELLSLRGPQPCTLLPFLPSRMRRGPGWSRGLALWLGVQILGPIPSLSPWDELQLESRRHPPYPCLFLVLTSDLSQHFHLPSLTSLHLKPSSYCTLNRGRGRLMLSVIAQKPIYLPLSLCSLYLIKTENKQKQLGE